MSAPDLARGVRASDAERERIAQILQSAAAEGRLSPEEAGERLAAASAATYREELEHLTADLPADRDRGRTGRIERPLVGAWWLWSGLRFAFMAMVLVGLWGFWGARLILWPLGLIAVALMLRPWRRRRWRMGAWHLRRS
jgi:Domain of unknown function (DUF1707)